MSDFDSFDAVELYEASAACASWGEVTAALDFRIFASVVKTKLSFNYREPIEPDEYIPYYASIYSHPGAGAELLMGEKSFQSAQSAVVEEGILHGNGGFCPRVRYVLEKTLSAYPVDPLEIIVVINQLESLMEDWYITVTNGYALNDTAVVDKIDWQGLGAKLVEDFNEAIGEPWRNLVADRLRSTSTGLTLSGA